MWLEIFGAIWVIQGFVEAWTGYRKRDSDYILLSLLAFLAGAILICAGISE